MKSEDEIMAYIAGLMDGDGSFSIIKEKRMRGSIYSPCIQLSNVFEGMVKFLYDLFGGSLKKKSVQRLATKQQYVWNVRGFESCSYFLNKVLPFLVLKKERAEFLLNFIDKFSPPKIEIGVDGRYLKKDIAEKGQESCHLRMQSFNNDCLVADGYVAKQAIKNTEDSIFWSYLAGIMETEGSFSIRKNKPSHGSKVFKYNPLMQLSMATFETMNHIRRNTCFGTICFPKAKTAQRGFVYKLSFGRISECISVIKNILPFLRFKKETAEILLDFCENYSCIKNRRAGVPIEELAYRESCYQKIIFLNKNGFNKPSLIDSETPKQGDEGQG